MKPELHAEPGARRTRAFPAVSEPDASARDALLASIVDSSDDAIIAKSPEGIITSWNRGAEWMYGYNASEILGRSIKVLLDPEHPEEMEAILARIRNGERVEHYETTRIRKNGRKIAVSLTVSPIFDSAGRLVGASSIARDITERQQSERAARENSRYARSLLEASLDPLVTISLQGKITDVNQATVKVTGVPREELVGTDFSGYFDQPEEAREAYRRVFSEGFVKDYPLTVHSRAGWRTHVLYNASLYKDADDNVLGVFAAARDVTAQHNAVELVAEQREKELERLADLERFQRLAVGRELKMIELKKEIERLTRMQPAKDVLG